MRRLKALCVFCGSSPGNEPEQAQAARAVGHELAQLDIELVYGGGAIGLMGIVADACLESGGKVTGIITEALAGREIAHNGVQELIVVPDMHQRKALMASRSDGFLTLPGGIGTFEEFFEVFSWAVLGIHAKPLGILNVRGYYDPMIELIEHAVRSGFIKRGNLQLLHISSEPHAIIESMIEAPRIQPAGPRWTNMSET